ncbi:MAG: dTMP kinase [Actinobacteria bacterium]|nr:dTMP kinase [Actinomycetota bacterium]
MGSDLPSLPPADARGEPGAELPLQSDIYRSLFANRAFRRLFIAMATSSLGDWIGLFAILALTENILGGGSRAAFGLSGVMVARLLPTLVFGPVAGVYADRWDRKRTMIAADIGRGAVMAVIPFVQDYFQLFVATLVVELLAMLFAPAKDATLPNLVARSRLVQANQLSLTVTYGTLPLGGVLVALFTGLSTTALSGIAVLADRPVTLAIWVNAATFFFSALVVAGIDVPRNGRAHTGGAETPGAWIELKQGFRFIATQPMVRALVVGVMGAFLGAGIVIAVGKLFATVVNAGDSGFGVLVAAVGIGLFVGLSGSGVLTRRLDKERLFAPGIATGGVGLIVLALMPRLDLATIPAFIMGVGAGVAFVTGYTLLQEGASDEVRGRTFASFNTGVRAALFISTVVAPLLAGFIGIEAAGRDGFYDYALGGTRITLIVGGIIALAGAVWSGSQIHSVLTRSSGLTLGRGTDRAADQGWFIVFEGGEGSGKSTQLRLLQRALEREGLDVLVTREPGGTEIGEQLRELVLHPEHHDMHDRTEALLYATARAQHAHRVIRPALDKGMIVLSDRFVDSSIVYQGAGRGLGEEVVEELNRWATDGLLPDLVVLLDVDAVEGLHRARSSATPPLTGLEPADADRLEAAGLAFHRHVNEAYRRRATAHEDRYLVLDAGRPVEDLAAEIRELVLELVAAEDEDPDAPSSDAPADRVPVAEGSDEPPAEGHRAAT